MNRRLEEQDLVLWRPGYTIWMSIWGNDNNESINERIQWIETDSSTEAYDFSIDLNRTPPTVSYKLNDVRGEDVVYALYTFAFKDDGHIQMAIYVDHQSDFTTAQQIASSIQ